jgi:hypothetical protein
MLGPCCLHALTDFLTIAVPVGVVWWGGFWCWRRRWRAGPLAAWERRWDRWLLVWGAVTLAEASLLVCVAAGATP